MFEHHTHHHRRIFRPLGLAAAATMALSLAGISPAHATPGTSSAAVANGVLTVIGTNRADAVTIDFTSTDTVGVELDGEHQSFRRGTFTSVSVFTGAGDDTVRTTSGGSAASDLPLTILAGNGVDTVTGGAGADTIVGDDGDDRLLGGAGNDLLFGGRGADFVNGQVGTDTEVLGTGDDTAGWLPGEGSDAVSGGPGVDTLAFTGSAGDEVMSLSASGHRAVFLRSPGSVRMDLDTVERLDVAPLGGADNVTIGDLTGTDLTEAVVDLSENLAGDHRDDTVVVDGTAGNDQIAIGADRGAVDVSGLQPHTRVTGAEPTDELDIDAGAGDDRVDVTDEVRALMDVHVDLGS
ncbi:MAG TPA: hypothetical protein VFE07_10900 [Marmoricola sp.]|nr:hypothetical protein [Marmoricola sp.]